MRDKYIKFNLGFFLCIFLLIGIIFYTNSTSFSDKIPKPDFKIGDCIELKRDEEFDNFINSKNIRFVRKIIKIGKKEYLTQLNEIYNFHGEPYYSVLSIDLQDFYVKVNSELCTYKPEKQ